MLAVRHTNILWPKAICWSGGLLFTVMIEMGEKQTLRDLHLALCMTDTIFKTLPGAKTVSVAKWIDTDFLC